MSGQKPSDDEKANPIVRFVRQRIVINPYYFVLLLIGLLGLNIYHVFAFEREFNFSPFFFLVYAIGQSLVEVLTLAFVANLILRYLHKAVYYFFVSLCFLCLFLHYIDFILIRFMDMSIFYGIDIILDETFDNFIEILHLSGVSIDVWMFVLAAAFIIVPLVGILLYMLTAKLAASKPLKLSHGHMLKALFCIPLSLIVLDLTFSPLVDKSDFRFYKRVLPWKATLIAPKEDLLRLKGPLKPSLDEKEALEKLNSSPVNLQKKPNIFLFVAESLREDFISEEAAPHLTAFRKENITLGQTHSNANATQCSWYAIFHSNYPFDWALKRKTWKSGSIPLQILKKLGYKVHLYSSAQLKYYGMGELIFGKGNYLADSYHLYTHYAPVTASESDKRTIKALMDDLNQKWAKEGNVFLVFLDSTHFNYSWPESYPLKFLPVSEEKTDLRVSNSIRDVELIKNRYRNSIHYVDSLFGKIVSDLKEKNLYEDSNIVFTGDHGEEFFEEGQLFHASHLSRMQTSPPIYYKLGNNQKAKNLDTKSILTSHVDIFPTLLDHLIGEEPFATLFQGESILKKDRFPYVIAGRHNGSRCPAEFYIHDGRTKLIARFYPEKNIHSSTTLKIISVQDLEDRPLYTGNSNQTEVYLNQVFGEAFNRIFERNQSK